MKKLLFITFLLISITSIGQTNWFDNFKGDYFISTRGSNTNSGMAPWEPWQTFTKLDSTVFAPGSRIVLRRGETWADTIFVNQNGTAAKPIVYGAYGNGVNPVINAFVNLNNYEHVIFRDINLLSTVPNNAIADPEFHKFLIDPESGKYIIDPGI